MPEVGELTKGSDAVNDMLLWIMKNFNTHSQNYEKRQFSSSFRPSVCQRGTTGRSCMKFGICVFFENITLVNDQLDAHLLYFIIRLLESSTCFKHRRAHHQEVKLY